VNNWPIVVQTLKDLHVQHVKNLNMVNEYVPNIKHLVNNDLVTCVRYHEHKMNSF
jgi:hypothetical protein